MSFGVEVSDSLGKTTLKVSDTTWFLTSFDSVSRYVNANPGAVIDIPVSAGGREIVVLNISGILNSPYMPVSVSVTTQTNLIRLTVTHQGRSTVVVEYTVL